MTLYARPNQTYLDHIRGICCKALPKAALLGMENMTFALILCHDLGKVTSKWQETMLQRKRPLPDHISAGAKILLEMGSPLFQLSYQHHGSLGNATASRLAVEGYVVPPECREWLRAEVPGLVEHVYLKTGVEVEFSQAAISQEFSETMTENVEKTALHLRLLFSLLGDFDRMDARETDTGESILHTNAIPSLVEAARQWYRKTDLSPQVRETIESVLGKHESPPCKYHLTSPHPVGKTLAALFFALSHAEYHSLDRIVIVVPYLAQVHEMARMLEEVLGQEMARHVLQHHTDVPLSDSRDFWDTSVVLTTTVRFWDMLTQHSKMGVGNLHNLTNSVIILDETQCSPVTLHDHIEAAIQVLWEEWGSSVIRVGQSLQTRTEDTPIPLCRTPEGVIDARVVHLEKEPQTFDTLLQRVDSNQDTLILVNTIRRALELHARMPEALCLTSRICSRDRKILCQELVELDHPRVVISTPLLETVSGLRFGQIWREFAPADNLLLSRSHLTPDGEMLVFDFRGESDASESFLTRQLLVDPEQLFDPKWWEEYRSQQLLKGTNRPKYLRALGAGDFQLASSAVTLVPGFKRPVFLREHPESTAQDTIRQYIQGICSSSKKTVRRAVQSAMAFAIPLTETEMALAWDQSLLISIASDPDLGLPIHYWAGDYDPRKGGIQFFP